MFKSVADRLGFPHSSSSHSLSSHHASGSSSPTSNSTGPHHHRSIFSSSPSSARSPSRQQQHHQQHSSATSPSSHNNGSRHITPSGRTTPLSGGRTTPAPPSTTTSAKPRKLSASTTATPKPVLPPLTFQQQPQRASQNLAQSVASASGVVVEEDSLASSMVSRAAENITVAVRVRPFSVAELRVAGGPTEVWAVQEDSRRIRYADDYSMRERRAAIDYTYDHALTGSDNELIYSTSVKNLVQSAMEGYNGTVFAYGQTSSGKTYTMSGTEKQPGITPRAVEDVFKYIRENSEREFLLRVSYLEIYNESIRDLLSPEVIDLRIHEDRKRGVYVSPLKEEIVTTPSQVMRILQRGDYQRHTSTTDYNAHSSRSHSIFQIVIESRERAPTAPQSPEGRKPSLGLKTPSAVRVSQLNLIDLAGSEKASTDMERRKEGAFINKSLLTLGTVISKLTDEKGSHIPYRDSKLTRILQSSLSGNARVSVICTISPSFLNVEESHNTLKFAARVKKVVTKAHTNQVMDDKALLEKYRREISELKAQLLLTAASTTSSSMSEVGSTAMMDQGKHAELSHLLERERLKHEEEMVEMNMIRNALKERIDHLTKLILTSQSINNNSSSNTKGAPALTGRPSSAQLPLMGRYTVETTADGTVLEFPKEIESRLARKDTIVRQLQTELESQQEKVSLMKAALQKTAKGEVVDIEKTLARVEMEPQRERFLIEKRASIMNLNAMMWQDGGPPNGVNGGSGSTGAHGRSVSGLSKRSPMAASSGTGTQGPLAPSALEHDLGKDIALEGEHLAIDDLDDDDDDLLMDTPWNRAELSELRQAKRELEIVVIDQEKKLEEMVAFEDSEEFRNLVIELEEQREKILTMEEEREAMRATITDFKNTIRKLEWGLTENGSQSKGGSTLGGMVIASPTQTLSASSVDGSSSSSSHVAAPAALPPAAVSRIQELEAMLQREKKLRMEEQARSMSRIASLEAEVTILKAEQSVRGLEETER